MGLRQAPQTGPGTQGEWVAGRLEGSAEGKVQQGKGRQGVATLALRATGAACVQGSQPLPLRAHSLRSQG